MGFTVPAKSLVQFSLPFLDEHRDERRRHGFGAGTKVKSIIERDCALRSLSFEPRRPPWAMMRSPRRNGGDHAETFASPAEYRLQDWHQH